ncbi:MAG: hypothetical protein WB820_04600, partial [Rhodoplanes sp.]
MTSGESVRCADGVGGGQGNKSFSGTSPDTGPGALVGGGAGCGPILAWGEARGAIVGWGAVGE